MPTRFDTPQDAEDAFYDAIDDNDLDAMMGVWDESDDSACLLPMQPLVRGHGKIREAWASLLSGKYDVDIEVRHIHWIEIGDFAVHLLQERANVQGQPQQQPPVYATNVYRNGTGGWRIILHQNSPTPPPPGMMPNPGSM